ncbi:MAG: FtsX-like permease family protein [Bryobacterales bacterium]
MAAQLPERLARLAEVRSLTVTDRVTFGEMVANPNASVTVPSSASIPTSEGKSKQAVHRVLQQRIGANYFSTLGVPLLRGREFSSSEIRDKQPPASDSAASGTRASGAARKSTAGLPAAAGASGIQPMVISEAGAVLLFGGRDPIGGRVRQGGQDYAVVGVSQDVKTAALMTKPAPTVYVPLTAEMFGHAMPTGATFLVRGAPGMDTIGAVRREMRSIDPALTVFNPGLLSERLAQFEQFMQLSSVFNGAFGLFGLILASIGLAAVTSHAVARRRKEIGIRTALGARRVQVLRLVLKEGVVLVVVGSLLGFVGAAAIARAASSITESFAKVFAVGTGDPILVIGAPLLLMILALLACYLPARKAAQVDPLVALREE